MIQIKKRLKTYEGHIFESNDLDQRGIASLIENYIQGAFANDEVFEYTEPESVRSIDDFTLEKDGHTYLMDVKTHDQDRKFSMPNLISVERLYKLYDSNPDTSFCLIIAKYREYGNCQKIIDNVIVLPIEKISWESLSVQNLGNGQIQITNLNKPILKFKGTRQQWMAEFTLRTVKFNERLKEKLEQRTKKWAIRSCEKLMECTTNTGPVYNC